MQVSAAMLQIWDVPQKSAQRLPHKVSVQPVSFVRSVGRQYSRIQLPDWSAVSALCPRKEPLQFEFWTRHLTCSTQPEALRPKFLLARMPRDLTKRKPSSALLQAPVSTELRQCSPRVSSVTRQSLAERTQLQALQPAIASQPSEIVQTSLAIDVLTAMQGQLQSQRAKKSANRL